MQIGRESTPRGGTERVEFLRAGKTGAGQSFNVVLIDGVPVTYNFSPNADLPTHAPLSPAQLRRYLDTGRCDTAAMRGFAATLRQKSRQSCPDARPAAPSGGGGAIDRTSPPAAGELVVESLAGLRPKPVRWLVPGLIPAGMMGLAAGEGGHGKTTFFLELAAAVSTGRCAFGLDYPNPARGKSLLIACEDDWERTTVPRLVALGADLGNVLRVKGVRLRPDGETLDFHLGHYRELERLLRAEPDVRLVTLDPAGAYVGRAGVNEHRDADLRAVLGPLSEAANRTAAAVILVKHLNKTAGATAVQRVSGSAGYVNAVRFAYLFAPDPADSARKLVLPMKRNVLPEGTKGLAYRMEPIPPAEAGAALLAGWPDLPADDLAALSEQLFRMAWEHDVDIDPNQVSGAGAGGRENLDQKAKECEAFVRSFLGACAWPDAELEAAVLRAGFSARVLKATKARMRTPDKSDPDRLSSKPKGEGGPWWVWVGPQADRPEDRPAPHTDQSDHTGETARTARTQRDRGGHG